MELSKLFAVKEPCGHCPFLEDVNLRCPLEEGRLEEIIEGLHSDVPFHCHKTIDYSKSSKKGQLAKASYCAGSLVYMQKCKTNNLPMRLGVVFGMFDPSQLRGHDKVINPIKESEE